MEFIEDHQTSRHSAPYRSPTWTNPVNYLRIKHYRPFFREKLSKHEDTATPSLPCPCFHHHHHPPIYFCPPSYRAGSRSNASGTYPDNARDVQDTSTALGIRIFAFTDVLRLPFRGQTTRLGRQRHLGGTKGRHADEMERSIMYNWWENR